MNKFKIGDLVTIFPNHPDDTSLGKTGIITKPLQDIPDNCYAVKLNKKDSFAFLHHETALMLIYRNDYTWMTNVVIGDIIY